MKKPKPPSPKFEVGNVIYFDKEQIEDEDYFGIDNKYLLRHPLWVIVRGSEEEPGGAWQIRLRSMDGTVAMTRWLVLYEEEIVIDPFLTAVHKAQKKSVVK